MPFRTAAEYSTMPKCAGATLCRGSDRGKAGSNSPKGGSFGEKPKPGWPSRWRVEVRYCSQAADVQSEFGAEPSRFRPVKKPKPRAVQP
jgi:hypothetical protein